ncbi:hypothetical protein FBUS_01157 [Fasciolopsis buskii]|uniref:Uncharacterized protein n=1 Tax=Fasciolopsis buskii TaxID=27845 RepID=A0A8E0RRF3_9TREM|nr:hypothetical protein FBUS_01157 [Fasciolopsis buski]
MTLKSMSSCTRRSISRVSRIVESRSDNLSNPHRQLESDLVEDMIHFTSGSTQLTREQLMSMHRNRFTTVYQQDFQHPKQQLTKYHSELQLLPNSAEETRTIADQDGVHTNPEVIGWREEMSQLRKSVARLERFNENDQISAPRTRYGSSGPYKSIAVGVLPKGLNKVYLHMTGISTYQDEISSKVPSQLTTEDHYRPFIGCRRR